MHEQKLNAELTAKCATVVPTTEGLTAQDEHLKKSKYGDEEIITFGYVEKWFYSMKDTLMLKERIELWIFKALFDESIQFQACKLDLLENEHDSIKDSEKFKKALPVCLTDNKKVNQMVLDDVFDEFGIWQQMKINDLLMYAYELCNENILKLLVYMLI